MNIKNSEKEYVATVVADLKDQIHHYLVEPLNNEITERITKLMDGKESPSNILTELCVLNYDFFDRVDNINDDITYEYNRAAHRDASKEELKAIWDTMVPNDLPTQIISESLKDIGITNYQDIEYTYGATLGLSEQFSDICSWCKHEDKSSLSPDIPESIVQHNEHVVTEFCNAFFWGLDEPGLKEIADYMISNDTFETLIPDACAYYVKTTAEELKDSLRDLTWNSLQPGKTKRIEEHNKKVMCELDRAINRHIDRTGLKTIAGYMVSNDTPEKIVSDRLAEIGITNYAEQEYTTTVFSAHKWDYDHHYDNRNRWESLVDEHNKKVMALLNNAIERGVDRETLEKIARAIFFCDTPEKVVSDRIEEVGITNYKEKNHEYKYVNTVVSELKAARYTLNYEIHELKKDEHYKDHSDDRELMKDNLIEKYNEQVMYELDNAINRDVSRESLETIADYMNSYDTPEKIVSNRLEKEVNQAIVNAFDRADIDNIKENASYALTSDSKQYAENIIKIARDKDIDLGEKAPEQPKKVDFRKMLNQMEKEAHKPATKSEPTKTKGKDMEPGD